MFRIAQNFLAISLFLSPLLLPTTRAQAQAFDTKAGLQTVLESLVLEGLGPAGDLASALQDSPAIVRVGVIQWLRGKVREAVANNDDIALDRYSTFLVCMSNGQCDGVRDLQRRLRPEAQPPAQPPDVGDFKILEAFAPAVVQSGGPHRNLTVYWRGTPSFPLTMTYRPRKDSCPRDINCATVETVFDTAADPLIFEGAVWCVNIPRAVYFDYEVILTDANGTSTAPKPAAMMCQYTGN